VDALLSLNKLAARLRLPRAWVRREAIAGRLPCLRVGRRLLFTLEAVERALTNRAANGRPGPPEGETRPDEP